MAQPAVADVRVSCPACGGPIHPIAGRCKHCRTDLVAVRGGGTGAQGTMIQIGQLGALGKVVAPGAPASAAPLVSPDPSTARPVGLPAATPVVPPPVALKAALVARPRSGLAKRWPLLVAAVAALAIIASIAVLVLGDSNKNKPKRRNLGPAPDRMQTDQLPTDPWGRPGAGSVDPSHGQMLPGAQAPDLNGPDDPSPLEDDEADEDEDEEPGGVVGGVVGGVPDPVPAADSPAQFLQAAIEVTCTRLSACWGATNSQSMCEQGRTMVRQQGAAVLDTLCPSLDRTAANQCLQQLASLPCPDQGASIGDLATMVYGLDPCMRACESP
jgi:hypothetical protein